MKIIIEKQRRKTIALKIIDSETVSLKVPYFLSQTKIDEFLKSKRNWIEKTITKLKRNENFSKNYNLKQDLYFFGEYVGKIDVINSASKEKIKNYYKSMFNKLEEEAKEISKNIDLSYSQMKLLTSVRIWGSFNTEKIMKLNWKLILLPKDIVRYVIIHELCHSKHMNHSKDFWNLVEKYCPNFKNLKKELNNFSFVLKHDFL